MNPLLCGSSSVVHVTHQRRWLVFALIVGAIFSGSGPRLTAAGTDVDAEYRDPNVSDAGHQIVILKDRVNTLPFSYLMGQGTPGRWGPLCDSLSDANCAGDRTVSFQALLQPCQSAGQLDCISGFGAATESNDRSAASFLRTFPSRTRHEYLGDATKKLPTGGAPTLWSLPSRPHPGGTTYMVQVSTSGSAQSGSFSLSDFAVEVAPISLVGDDGFQCDLTQETKTYEDCGEDQGPGFYVTDYSDDEPIVGLASRVSNSEFDCLVLAEKQCARRHAFSHETRLYLTVRLSQAPTGWLHGRVSKPLVAINTLSGTGVEIDIAATTVKTPMISTSMRWTDLPAPLRESYRATGGFEGAPAGTRNRTTFDLGPEIRNAISAPTAYSTTGMAELLAWLPHIGDKATADISRWTLRSMSDAELAGASSCFANRSQLNGLLMTNATQYSAGPPTFDRSAGSLEYKVAAPHYTSGGSTFLGTYDLVMRSTVARCLYGFTNAPLNVSISVLDSDGVSSVATKVVSERDGWLRIAAYGFGFSAPTIKVQMTQESAAETKPAKKLGTKTKSKTITCVKGKTVRKVTAPNPKCPKGFKKK